MGVSTKMVHVTLHKDLQLSKKVGQIDDWTALRGDEEEQKTKCKAFVVINSRFMTILDKVLTVGESTGVEGELAGLSLTKEAS